MKITAALLLARDRRPVDPLGQLARAQVYQRAVLDRLVLAVFEPQPVDCVRDWIDDQHLLDVMGGVKGELVPAAVAGGDDLDDERGRGHVHAGRPLAVDAEVGYPVVVLHTEVELQAYIQALRTGGLAEQYRELSSSERVGGAGSGGHVVGTFPHLVVTVQAKSLPALDQRLEIGRRQIHHHGGHGLNPTARIPAPATVFIRGTCHDAQMEIEIGRGKKARQAYGFDDIAIVPSRRTRDPDDIDISWKLGPYQFELPMLASAMDGVVSPETAGIVGQLGGLAVLNLEGIFTRYEDAEEQLERISELPKELATREMQDIYREPVKPELIAQRIAEIKEHKVVVAASLTPQRVRDYYELALDAGLDVLVIQGTVVSGEHVSTVSEPLNLKEFIPSLEVPVVVGGCASYHTGLHLMRTGAAGVLVGVGPGAACTTRGVLGIGVPQATAIADVAHARSTHMLETGEYCHVIADGGMRNGGDVSKAIALGADAVMIGSPLARAYEAPGRGFHWGMATFHPTLPRGARVATTQNGTLEEILVGPARENDGTFNLFGGLRTSMATCGHKDLAEFNRAEVVIAPALQTEGKALQRDQAVGMGAVGGKAAAPTPMPTPVLVND
jgi:IMP dehydrogenase